MKNTLVAIIALALLGVVIWGWVRSQRTSPYTQASVVAEISRIASASGAEITDRRSVGATLRGSRHGPLDRWFREISGKPLYDDVAEFTLTDGTGTVRVSLYHSLGNVGSVEIRPSGMPSAQAAALESGLNVSFPRLDCRVKSP